jgi:hypothetical protein
LANPIWKVTITRVNKRNLLATNAKQINGVL